VNGFDGNLRRLEQDGLVARRDLGGAVPHVEYDFRSEMRPAIESMLDQLASFDVSMSEHPPNHLFVIRREVLVSLDDEDLFQNN
jgi:hypothetical protein